MQHRTVPAAKQLRSEKTEEHFKAWNSSPKNSEHNWRRLCLEQVSDVSLFLF